MQVDFYYQFQVSIIAQKIFLLILYLFRVQKKMFYFVVLINWKNKFQVKALLL